MAWGAGARFQAWGYRTSLGAPEHFGVPKRQCTPNHLGMWGTVGPTLMNGFRR